MGPAPAKGCAYGCGGEARSQSDPPAPPYAPDAELFPRPIRNRADGARALRPSPGAIAALSGTLALASLPASAAGQAAVLTDASNIVVNGGKPVVVGASGTTSVPVTMTVTGPARKTKAGAMLFHGRNYTDAADAWGNPGKGCGVNSATSFTCRMTFAFTARQTVKKNAMAGVWGVHAWAAGTPTPRSRCPSR